MKFKNYKIWLAAVFCVFALIFLTGCSNAGTEIEPEQPELKSAAETTAPEIATAQAPPAEPITTIIPGTSEPVPEAPTVIVALPLDKPASEEAAEAPNLSGHHVQIYANGDRYDGSLADGVRHGYGTYKWANGDIYTGKFVDGIQNDEDGIYTWANGTVYYGEFVNGKPSGNGTYYPTTINAAPALEEHFRAIGLSMREVRDEIDMFIRAHSYADEPFGIVEDFVNTLYVMYQTYRFETALGTIFEFDEHFCALIPAEMIHDTVSLIYGIDGSKIDYSDDWNMLYISQEHPGYFRLPDGFDFGHSTIDIQWDTWTVNHTGRDNNAHVFNVKIRYPYDDIDTVRELFTFEFEEILYKGQIPIFRFISAT